MRRVSRSESREAFVRLPSVSNSEEMACNDHIDLCVLSLDSATSPTAHCDIDECFVCVLCLLGSLDACPALTMRRA